jgi:hypothetical protein
VTTRAAIEADDGASDHRQQETEAYIFPGRV